MYKTLLIEKFSKNNATIGVVGLGYVGLPLVLRFCELGFQVRGFDIDEQKVEKLRAGQSYIAHIQSELIQNACQNYFTPTTDFNDIEVCDVVILCVPTPLNTYREPDLTFVINTIDAIVPHLRAGQVIALESTTYPGTTAEVVAPRLTAADWEIGQDIFLVYAPEREDPGNGHHHVHTIPRVCSGHTPACLDVAIALYQKVTERVVPVSSTQTAEMVKLLENIHRAVNIGLVNEMKIVADKMGIDIFEVVNAAASKPFGFVPYYPGPGLGGHCIPIDPFYLTWKAREYGVHTRFIELAGEINNAMPDYVVQKVTDGLNSRRLALSQSKILLLGLAYKENVDDTRESPGVEILEILVHKGAVVAYSDPYVLEFPKMRRHHFDLQSISLTEETLQDFDAVVLVTAHQKYDYPFIAQHAKLIIDCRGVYSAKLPNVMRA